MAADKESTMRRVYVLPTELVDRITSFQADMKLQSEVEAARRLLDEALKQRDDAEAITRRFLERLKDTRMMSDIAKDVLVGHPLINQIKINASSISFGMTTGDQVTVFQDGTASMQDRHKQSFNINSEGQLIRDDIPF
ncbi:hypothetical protein FJ955_02960 [Mesorhizobium sp. B2-2-2]|uniref:hypothetical protein n=1 Tax=Mesorhizobium sp. B2-2-2 TaxID=2589964 RepID=UPI0011264E41|nr:hypothetical protein [Mesorhizobium sp. B2-2-2]TPM33717.1 hypothetical protein FJ955_02960 [Mesorhizobium sp. B2-2-2]